MDHLEANLAAMASWTPESARAIAAAKDPPSARQTAARDAEPTFTWEDAAGRPSWLGRTTMPRLRAEALLESFDPGMGNVLFESFGHGVEARLLLLRLLPHQALIVVDEEPVQVRLSLRLADYSPDLRRGRLLVFAGPEAWSSLQSFLATHDGFLPPERILSWPWFDHRHGTRLSNRLSSINTAILQRRAGSPPRPIKSAAARHAATPRLAILSNLPDERIHRLAARIAAAAEHIEVPASRFVLDDPALVHPSAITAALATAAPTLSLLLDVTPDALPYPVPPGNLCIMAPGGNRIPPESLAGLSTHAFLAVRSSTQKAAALAAGLPEPRVLVLPPAAAAGAGPRPSPPAGRVALVGDRLDISAAAAGLHLASHCRLWEAVTAMISADCDAHEKTRPEELLTAALRRVEFNIESREVRAGLADRIHTMLRPGLIRRETCLALDRAGIGFDLFGAGWATDRELSRAWRGHWPAHSVVGDEAPGLLVFLEVSDHIAEQLLDAVAAGCVVAARALDPGLAATGLADVLDPERHLCLFRTRAGLIDLIRRFTGSPADLAGRALAASAEVCSGHTWAHRLRQLLHAAG
jgi:hypothetical protein